MVYTLVVHLHAKEGEENLSKLKAKLAEASQVYSKDKETLGWYVILCVCEIYSCLFWKRTGKEKTRKRGRKCQGRCGNECCVVLCESFLDGLNCIS